MISFNDFKLIRPRPFARLLCTAADEPSYKIIRPEIASIDDAMAWAHDQVWRFNGDFDCRQTVKRLLFMRMLVLGGTVSDDNR